MPFSMDIVCRECGHSKPEGLFYTSLTNGKIYRRKICISCDKQKRGERPWSPATETAKANRLLAEQRRRRDPKFAAKYIVQDSRASDKRKGRENNLSREWVEQQIQSGCSYCGEQELRMTLDRVDNSKGHTRDNVRVACLRCNYLRRDTPFEAWLILIDAIRKAREQGAFGDWIGGLHGRD